MTRPSRPWSHSGVAALALCAVTASTTLAQSSPTPKAAWAKLGAPSGSGKRAPDTERRSALRDQFSIERYRLLLGSEDAEDRLLAIERLRHLRSPAKLALLHGALQESIGDAIRIAEARACITALADHVKDSSTEHLLTRVVTGAAASKGSLVHPFLRTMAALALAQSESREAVTSLAKIMRTDESSAPFAAAAFRAYPPHDPSALWFSAGQPGPTVVRFLGELGDQRAFHPLRAWAKKGTAEIQAEALLALTELGHYETATLAEHWLEQGARGERLRVTAEVLAATGSPKARAAFSQLFQDPAEADRAIVLAQRFPGLLSSPTLIAHLSRRSSAGDEVASRRVLAALARQPDRAAVDFFISKLGHPHLGPAAAHALGHSTHPEARPRLHQLLSRREVDRATLRSAVMAALVRRARFQEAAPLDPWLHRWAQSKDPEDRTLGTLGLALTDEAEAIAAIESGDPARVSASAWTFGLQGPRFWHAAGAALAASSPGPLRSALAFALLDEKARARVPDRVIRELYGALETSTVAALAWAARAPDAELTGLLRSPNVAIRAHAALGAAQHPDAGVTGMLHRRYLLELDEGVRLALIRSIVRRGGARSAEILSLAERLDPSERVRQCARLGRYGADGIEQPELGTGVLLLEVVPAPDRPTLAEVRIGPVLTAPVMTDAGGTLWVFGVGPGPLEVALGPRARERTEY